MAEYAHHFIALASHHGERSAVERGLNLCQVITYDYNEHGGDGSPEMSLLVAGGGKLDYHGDDARYLHRLLRGKF